MNKRVLAVGALLSALTSGFILGLGFIAAAAKFRATRPSLLQLLDVGHEQFWALHIFEWVLVPLACVLVWLGHRELRGLSVATSVVFLVQSLAILPPLDSRMVLQLNGETLPGSFLHFAYVGVAGLLCALLITICWQSMQVLADSRRSR